MSGRDGPDHPASGSDDDAEPPLRAAVRRATRVDGLRIAARLGYLVSGTLHLLIGYVIVRIATGGEGSADPSGALATVAETRGGVVALWLIALLLIPLALWRLFEAVIGVHPAEGHDPTREDASTINRLKAFGLMIVYCGVAFTALRFALGSHESSREQNVGLSARLLHAEWGRIALIAGGVVIVAIGGYYAYKGAARKFRADLTSPPGRLLTALGVCGYVAEGIVLALTGILVVSASVDSDPTKAAGLDAAVKTLGSTGPGHALLVVAAGGFAAYGTYCYALSRRARM